MNKLEETKTENLILAKIAQKSKRYKDMVHYMNKIAELEIELTTEERNLFGISYKYEISNTRKVLSNLKNLEVPMEYQKKNLKSYISHIEREIENICLNCINILEKHLLPTCQNGESKAFYLKMKADHYRYLAETKDYDQKLFQKYSNSAFLSYKEAIIHSSIELSPTNIVRLGISLNFSSFYHDVLNKDVEACQIIKVAFDDAVTEIDTITDDEQYHYSTIILQIMKQNLIEWSQNLERKSNKILKNEENHN